jgi:hypothetical protein
MSTSAVGAWQPVNFKTENLTKVPNEFLSLIQVPSIVQIKTQVLNLKTLKGTNEVFNLFFF